MSLVLKFRTEIIGYGLRIVHALLRSMFHSPAASQFTGSKYRHSLGKSESTIRLENIRGLATQFRQTVMTIPQDSLHEFHSRLPVISTPYEDGKQLGFGERICTVNDEFLAGAVFHRLLIDVQFLMHKDISVLSCN